MKTSTFEINWNHLQHHSGLPHQSGCLASPASAKQEGNLDWSPMPRHSHWLRSALSVAVSERRTCGSVSPLTLHLHSNHYLGNVLKYRFPHLKPVFPKNKNTIFDIKYFHLTLIEYSIIACNKYFISPDNVVNILNTTRKVPKLNWSFKYWIQIFS